MFLNETLQSLPYFIEAYTETVCVPSSSMPWPCFGVGRGYVPGIPKSPTTTLLEKVSRPKKQVEESAFSSQSKFAYIPCEHGLLSSLSTNERCDLLQ